MKENAQAVPRQLDRAEMLALVGGGDGTGFFEDLGYAIGYIIGCVSVAVQFASDNPPPSYAYGKVGYSS